TAHLRHRALSRGYACRCRGHPLQYGIAMPVTHPEYQGMSDGGRKLDQTTSLSLLERARRRDPQAWDRLVQMYRPLVLFWCRRGGFEGADAGAVSEEVFAAAAGGMERFRRDHPGDTFRGWLRGITRNQALLFYRRSQKEPRAEGGSVGWDQLQAVPDPLAGAGDEEQAEVGQLYRRALD